MLFMSCLRTDNENRRTIDSVQPASELLNLRCELVVLRLLMNTEKIEVGRRADQHMNVISLPVEFEQTSTTPRYRASAISLKRFGICAFGTSADARHP
jgi:hypothetical protein